MNDIHHRFLGLNQSHVRISMRHRLFPVSTVYLDCNCCLCWHTVGSFLIVYSTLHSAALRPTRDFTLAVCVMQAVRAASEAQQTSSGTEAGPLPLRAGAKLTSLRKPPAASKPTKAKRVIIRKRAQPPSDEEAQQVGAARGAAALAGHLVD